MTYALGYLAMALVTAAVGVHILRDALASKRLDTRVKAYEAVVLASVGWPAMWTAIAWTTVRKIAAGLRR